MERRDQRKLTKNMLLVKRTILKDLEAIVRRLQEERVLSAEAGHEITFPRNANTRCGIFINKLIRAGPTAFGVFRKVLEERGHSKLVNTLENAMPVEQENKWLEEREKTFVIDRVQPSPKSNVECAQTTPVCRLERMITALMLSSVDETEEGQLQSCPTRKFDRNNNSLLRGYTNQSTFVLS